MNLLGKRDDGTLPSFMEKESLSKEEVMLPDLQLNQGVVTQSSSSVSGNGGKHEHNTNLSSSANEDTEQDKQVSIHTFCAWQY